MNNSRRKFLEKAPAVTLAVGVGIASGKIAMASPPEPNEGTRPLLDAFLAGQRQANGKLYAANDLLLGVLRAVIHHVPGINVAAANAKLDEAEGYIDAIPNPDPPGCELPPGFLGY
ncbi:MAG: hypothetical protein M3R68_01225 [Acidobacteriota bacterium]|nr:hypothetical protein [Acidobacteriota bacterium]